MNVSNQIYHPTSALVGVMQNVPKFPLASAIAVSAAFPGGFGPLSINTKEFNWFKRDWGASVSSAARVSIEYVNIHLYDGGVYDNLGLEPFFDCGSGETKLNNPNEFILISDAGAPLRAGFSFGALNPLRLKRVADIMADQTHALRVRAFHHYLEKDAKRGVLLAMGTSISETASCASKNFAVEFPTTLRRVSTLEFDRIANHGYKVALKLYKK